MRRGIWDALQCKDPVMAGNGDVVMRCNLILKV